MKIPFLIITLFITNLVQAQLETTDKKIVNEYCKSVNSSFKGVSSSMKEAILQGAESEQSFEVIFVNLYMQDSTQFLKDSKKLETLTQNMNSLNESLMKKYNKTMDEVYTNSREALFTYMYDTQSCKLGRAFLLIAEHGETEETDDYYDYYYEEGE